MRRYKDRHELLQQVVTLRRQGLSRRAIARSLQVSRNTVRKLLRDQAQARQEPHTALKPPPQRAPRPKKTDAYRPRIEALLEKYPTVTAQRVFEIIGDEGYEGGYTAVKDLLRTLRRALGYDSVERILETRFHPRRLEEYITADTARELEAKLGYRRTERSDLAEYDRLSGDRNPEHEEPSDAPETPPDETNEDQEP